MSATIDPTHLPQLAIGNLQHEPGRYDDLGPEQVGQQDILAMADKISFGAFDPIQPEAVQKGLDAMEQAEFDNLFALQLRQTPLSTPHVMEHRAFALYRVLANIAAHGGAGVAPQSRDAAIGNLEAYLFNRTAEIAESFTDAQLEILRDHAFMLTPAQLSVMAGLPEQTLANMRQTGNGPGFAKPGGKPRSPIRYPAAGVLAWLRAGGIRN